MSEGPRTGRVLWCAPPCAVCGLVVCYMCRRGRRSGRRVGGRGRRRRGGRERRNGLARAGLIWGHGSLLDECVDSIYCDTHWFDSLQRTLDCHVVTAVTAEKRVRSHTPFLVQYCPRTGLSCHNGRRSSQVRSNLICCFRKS